MNKLTLIAICAVGLAGCSTIVAPLASDYTTSTGDQIRIAYANPDKSYGCELKGQSAFNPNSQSILGVVSIGPSDEEVDRLVNATFGEEANAVGANYVNRGFAGASSFGGVYQRSSTIEAMFYECETLPTL